MAERPTKVLQICRKCGGYMRPLAAFSGDATRRDWKDETFHRSFGGVAMRKFVCEKCHQVDTFQVDEVGVVDEDP